MWRSLGRALVRRGTGGGAGGGEDQTGGGFGGVVDEVGQHAGVGVGGEHDAGMVEHCLHGLEVVAGGRGQAGVADRAVEQLAEPVGFDRVSTLVGEDGPAYLALDGGGGVGR